MKNKITTIIERAEKEKQSAYLDYQKLQNVGAAMKYYMELSNILNSVLLELKKICDAPEG